MDSDFRNAKVGDAVVSGKYGRGSILSTENDNDSYPITVIFEDGDEDTYTLEGKSNDDSYTGTACFDVITLVKYTNKSKTEVIGSAMSQIPFEGLEAIGQIFLEGEVKYGRDNWKINPTKEYQEERCNHAIRHLMLWANGDRTEPHLAKVGWFVVTQLWTEKNVNSSIPIMGQSK